MPVGNFAAVHAVQRKRRKARNTEVSEKRLEAVREQAKKNNEARALIKKYDTNGSGKLEKDQVAHLLKDLNNGQEVSQDELVFIMAVADASKNDAIGPSEIEFMLLSWQNYMKSGPEIDPLLAKYDVSGTGRLEKGELKKLLVDLNDGKAVQESDVDFVLEEADLLGNGVITRPEMRRALAIWYGHVDAQSSAGCCTLL